jgi:hypothetical protein
MRWSRIPEVIGGLAATYAVLFFLFQGLATLPLIVLMDRVRHARPY